ncbi:MAG: hypothetical protein KKD63_16495 [Proteobacteria bacterium]|nr:hypothetical protein [Desulfobulbaceae bacterium]MBU4154471.1 hypothetical protein [Pseudomonadota bacterium]
MHTRSFQLISGSALWSPGSGLLASHAVRTLSGRSGALRTPRAVGGWLGLASVFYVHGNFIVRGVNSAWVRGASFSRSNLAVEWDWPRVGFSQAGGSFFFSGCRHVPWSASPSLLR